MNAHEQRELDIEIIQKAFEFLRGQNSRILADYANDRGKFKEVAERAAIREIGMVRLVNEIEARFGQKILQPLHKEIYQDEGVAA